MDNLPCAPEPHKFEICTRLAFMKGYGQFCPVAKAAEILAERWTLLVVRELLMGSRRFNDLRRGVPLMSPTLLSDRLKELESAGIVEKRRASGEARGWEYDLTQAGRELMPIVESLGMWGARYARSRLEKEDLDPSLLLWDIRRRIDVAYFGQGRTLVEFELRGAVREMRRWWLLVERGTVDLCLKPTGFEPDLVVTSTVRTLTAVWMGDEDLMAAVRSGGIGFDRDCELARTFPGWFRRSLFAGVAVGVSRAGVA